MLTRLAALAVAGLMAALPAQAFPTKNIEILIPYGPGGGFDTVVRRLAPELRKILGVEVVPVNMPGANGRRAAAVLMNAKPDGHTIMIFNMPGHGLDYIRGVDGSYDINAVTWLGQVGEDRYVVLSAAKNDKIKTIEDVPKLGRPIKIPDQGPSSTSYIANQITWTSFGVEQIFVSGYRSSQEYTTAVLRGDGDLTMAVAGSAKRYNATGDYNILAEFTDNPDVRMFPEAPRGADLGKPELDQLGLRRMLGGPPGMPADVVKKLSDAIVAAVNTPEVQAWADETDNPMIALDATAAAKAVRESLEFHKKFGHLFKGE